jgi:hypothetical protein
MHCLKEEKEEVVALGHFRDSLVHDAITITVKFRHQMPASEPGSHLKLRISRCGKCVSFNYKLLYKQKKENYGALSTLLLMETPLILAF